jgi:predicted component of type VI protein secretion system
VLALGLFSLSQHLLAQDSDLATIQEKIKQTQAQLEKKLKSSERLQAQIS